MTNRVAFEAMADTIQSWIDWNAKDRANEHLTTEDGTSIMAIPVPYWPTHGQMADWIKALRKAAETADAKDGYVLVPKEPTEAMLGAEVAPEHASVPFRNWRDRRYAMYCAMIGARPK